MLTESKQIENILPISAISIIQEDPSKFAREEFIDWSKKSTHSDYENPWLDQYNQIKIELEGEYEGQDLDIKIGLKIIGIKIKKYDVAISFKEFNGKETIDLRSSTRDVIMKFVSRATDIASLISRTVKSGKSRFDIDYNPEQEETDAIKKAVKFFNPLENYYAKKEYKVFARGSHNGNFEITVSPDDPIMNKIHTGFWLSYQFKQGKSIIKNIVSRANQIGFILSEYGINSDDGIWMHFKQLNPESFNIGYAEIETGKFEKIHLKANKVQQDDLDRIYTWLDKRANDLEVYGRNYEAIKKLFTEIIQ